MRFNFWKKKSSPIIQDVRDYWLFVEPPQPSLGHISTFSTISGISYALFVKAGVSKVLIVENMTRHTVEVVVESGDDSLVADVIYENMPIGVLPVGNIELIVKAPDCIGRTIKFSRFR